MVGGNGTGKSTTLSLLSGVNAPYRGEVRLEGKKLGVIPDSEKFGGLLGVLPQNPQALFVKKTVELDLYEMLSDKNLLKKEREKKVAEAAELCELGPLLGQHPHDLSGGEQQRAALAKAPHPPAGRAHQGAGRPLQGEAGLHPEAPPGRGLHHPHGEPRH